MIASVSLEINHLKEIFFKALGHIDTLLTIYIFRFLTALLLKLKLVAVHKISVGCISIHIQKSYNSPNSHGRSWPW